ncbi:hypothetical protein BO78DRAFT_141121 [Aspergillus sclerotiicarbonarius CBS 121057]|uniref:Uncharacterized protein n=1 Tax=Aspergillus sclerotiicarbonarius (strain CBS 121057 / IBT 28362) TaxID=1448318 RepID=A0A319ED51_ASPSB|nr:hypothetical protein BO78DRAFT_141121 [Aspergillus sclerotiicarbonarius CBS 121057]
MESDDDVMTCFRCSFISCLCEVEVCGLSSAGSVYFRGHGRGFDLVVSFQRDGSGIESSAPFYKYISRNRSTGKATCLVFSIFYLLVLMHWPAICNGGLRLDHSTVLNYTRSSGNEPSDRMTACFFIQYR